MSTLRTTTIANLAGTKAAPVADVVDGYAKAWVNFNGTGTVAIRKAFNVSSITDNGVGDWTVNFSAALADANYAAVATAGGTANVVSVATQENTTARTTTLVRVLAINTSMAAIDAAQVSVVVLD